MAARKEAITSAKMFPFPTPVPIMLKIIRSLSSREPFSGTWGQGGERRLSCMGKTKMERKKEVASVIGSLSLSSESKERHLQQSAAVIHHCGQARLPSVHAPSVSDLRLCFSSFMFLGNNLRVHLSNDDVLIPAGCTKAQISDSKAIDSELEINIWAHQLRYNIDYFVNLIIKLFMAYMHFGFTFFMFYSL